MSNPNELNIINKSFMTAIIPYLGAIAVFISLIINNYISSRFRKRDVQRNWYLKVLIEPNIKNIDKFYEDISEMFSKSVDLLNSKKHISNHEILKIRAHENGIFQELKRKFENNFIRLIMLSYEKYPNSFFEEVIRALLDNDREEKSISDELTDVLLHLEDFYTEGLANYSLNGKTVADFEKLLTLNKATLISILFKPLR